MFAIIRKQDGLIRMTITMDEFDKGVTPINRDKCEPKDAFIFRMMNVPNVIGVHVINPPVLRNTRILANKIYWNKDTSFKGVPDVSDYKQTRKPQIMSDENYRVWFIKEYRETILKLITEKDAYRVDEIADHLFKKVYTELDTQIIKSFLIAEHAKTIDVDADRYYFK